MKKIMVIFILVLCLPSFGYCQKDSVILKLGIKSDKSFYKTGEPIKIDYQISNVSEKSISIDPPFSNEGMIDPSVFSGTFFVQRQEDKNSIEVFPLADIDWERTRSVEIAPQESYKRVINIIGMIEYGTAGEVPYSTNLFLYKGGRYKIIAKFIPRLARSACWKKVLESNAIFITIEEKKCISQDEALRIAKKACLQSGWVWGEVKLMDRASEGLYVITNVSKRDGYIEIHIGKEMGQVLRKFRRE